MSGCEVECDFFFDDIISQYLKILQEENIDLFIRCFRTYHKSYPHVSIVSSKQSTAAAETKEPSSGKNIENESKEQIDLW